MSETKPPAQISAKNTAKAAAILGEALPYIRKFQDSIVVIKLGGSTIGDPELMAQFARDLVMIKLVGMNPVVVHGGGPQIDEALDALGKQAKFVNGLRVTDAESMRVVQKVLVGEINQNIVALINQHGGEAVGISGKDASLLRAQRMKPEDGVDLGEVGEITEVNCRLLEVLFTKGMIPVVAPVGLGEQGQAYNINADLAASAIAKQLGAEKLILLTNTSGVLDENGKLISRLNSQDAAHLISDQTIKGGMIPKVSCALEAVSGGVHNAHIIDGRVEHALLVEILTESGVGTLISKSG